MKSEELDLDYKFCKENQIILHKDTDSINIIYTEDADIASLSYLQKFYKLPLSISKVSIRGMRI